MFLSPKSPFFLLLLAAPLMLGNPATLATEEIDPNPTVLAQTAEERKAEADRLKHLGIEQYESSQFREAMLSWKASLKIYRDLNVREAFAQESRQGEANCLNNLGLVYRSLGEYEKAIDFHQQSLAINRELNNRNEEAKVFDNLGLVYNFLGEYEKAIDFHQQSLAIFENIGNRNGEAKALCHLGLVYHFPGKYEEAFKLNEKALTIFRKIGDLSGQTLALIGLGNILNSRGEFSMALEFYQNSLAIKQELGDRRGEAGSLAGLGNVYHNLGQEEKAIELHYKSLDISQDIGDRSGEADTLNNLGLIYSYLGQYQKALELYQQSITINQQLHGGKITECACVFINLADVYHSLKQYEKAIDIYHQALAIDREIGNIAGEAKSLNGLGNVYRSLKYYEKALEFYQQSLAIYREVGDLDGEATALNKIGLTYYKIDQYERATEALFSSIKIHESLSHGDLPDHQKISFFDTQTSPYKWLQQSLIAQGKIEQALEISERGRTRAFASLIAQRQGLHPAEEPLPPISIAQIQQLARQENTTLVQYSAVSCNLLYVWVIQPTGNIHFREIDLNSIEQNFEYVVTETCTISGIRSRAGAPPTLKPEYAAELRAQTDRTLAQFYNWFVAPIADLLPTDPEAPIVFVPHQSLFLVPFPALLNADGEYLIQNHTILTAPSIQVLELTRQARRGDGETGGRGEVLVVGNPTMPRIWDPETGESAILNSLPGSQREAETIANLFATQPLVGSDATETAVTQRMKNARIIHLATHGLLDYGIPEETGVRDFPGAIALAEGNGADGLLTSAELLGMELQAELVVLSACNTGRGNLSSDGVIGLSRALISAGVPNVMVSLWSVPDAPTAELMSEFYRQWQTTGNQAQALRQAMLVTMETHPEPRDWAAFTLVGFSNK